MRTTVISLTFAAFVAVPALAAEEHAGHISINPSEIKWADAPSIGPLRCPCKSVIQLHGTGPWGITYLNPEEDPRKK